MQPRGPIGTSVIDGESAVVWKDPRNHPMRLSVTISAIALIAGTLSPTSFAYAAPSSSVTTVSAPTGLAQAAASVEGETHCVGEALPLGSTETASEPVCFSTPEEAAAHLDNLTQVSSRGVAAASSIVLGTVYSDANYGGSTYTLFGSGTCSGVTFGFPSLSGGWDSIISSAKAASGCWVTLYKTTSYGGEKINCMPGCPTISTLNDQVRSIVLRPQGTVG